MYHSNDVQSALFDSDTLISIQYHVRSHVSMEALCCVLWCNKLNKPGIVGGEGLKSLPQTSPDLVLVNEI